MTNKSVPQGGALHDAAASAALPSESSPDDRAVGSGTDRAELATPAGAESTGTGTPRLNEGARETASAGLPWRWQWPQFFIIATLSAGIAWKVPVFDSIYVIVTIGIIAIVTTHTAIFSHLFDYVFRIVMLLFWTTAAYNYFSAFGFCDELRGADGLVRVLKAFSLITMMLDGFAGVEYAERQFGRTGNPLFWAKAGAGSCIVGAMILIVSVFPEGEAHMRQTILLGYPATKIQFAIALNTIAIAPIFLFFVNNYSVTHNPRITDKYVNAICSDFLWYINIPAILCTITMFTFASILENLRGAERLHITHESIEGILSGGMCFLIFSAILIGVRIEQHHQNELELRRVRGSHPPGEAVHAGTTQVPSGG